MKTHKSFATTPMRGSFLTPIGSLILAFCLCSSVADCRTAARAGGLSKEAEGKEVDFARKTGLVYHRSYLQHNTGENHPESADRLTAIIRHLEETSLLCELRIIAPEPAVLKWIATVLTSEYIEEVERSCQAGQEYLYSSDTAISAQSYEVARLAVGGVLKAIDAVIDGKVKNAFCAIRPPGHHAMEERAMGFCLFNSVAIGARYIQKKHGLAKVLIVDWDVHHGNGTQSIFYDDPTVLYFSIHQHPFYPGSGSDEERGTGTGYGYNMNVPLRTDCDDKEYEQALQEILRPRAIEFNPDFVLISAGFDAHRDDPLGDMRVTPEGFAELTEIVKDIAEQTCEGRLISILEGGYGLDGLANSVGAHISVLRK